MTAAAAVFQLLPLLMLLFFFNVVTVIVVAIAFSFANVIIGFCCYRCFCAVLNAVLLLLLL